MFLVVRARDMNHLLSAGDWPEFDPRVQRNLMTICSTRSMKQVTISSIHTKLQLTPFVDIIQPRFRNRQKRTTFQMRLDDLKSEWDSTSVTTTRWLMPPSEKKLGLKLSESSDEQANEDEVISNQDSQQQDSDDNDSDNDTDEFVVQDDGSVIPDLPIAFSRHSHQDTRHVFKVVCQLFVHLATMPMDERRAYMEEMLKGTILYFPDAIDG